LVLRLDAFGQCLHAKAFAQRDHCPDDRPRIFAV
jgi:hypothetical protein